MDLSKNQYENHFISHRQKVDGPQRSASDCKCNFSSEIEQQIWAFKIPGAQKPYIDRNNPLTQCGSEFWCNIEKLLSLLVDTILHVQLKRTYNEMI